MNASEEARTKVGCMGVFFIIIAALVGCVAAWVAFGPVVGLLSIAGVIVLLGLSLLFLVIAEAKGQKKAKEEKSE